MDKEDKEKLTNLSIEIINILNKYLYSDITEPYIGIVKMAKNNMIEFEKLINCIP